jgi:hypothetical protein
MSAFKAKVTGLNKMLSTIDRLNAKAPEIVDNELTAGALEMAGIAKRRAPVDEGTLRNGIGADISKPFHKEFFSSVFWSAYMEFGTGTKTKIPAGYEDFARLYKGKAGRGNIMQFFYRLIAWVRRKGISGTYSVKTRRRTGNKKTQAQQDYEVAYLIMRSILKYGVNPQPFFIPAYEQTAPKIVDRIRKQLKRI